MTQDSPLLTGDLRISRLPPAPSHPCRGDVTRASIFATPESGFGVRPSSYPPPFGGALASSDRFGYPVPKQSNYMLSNACFSGRWWDGILRRAFYGSLFPGSAQAGQSSPGESTGGRDSFVAEVLRRPPSDGGPPSAPAAAALAGSRYSARFKVLLQKCGFSGDLKCALLKTLKHLFQLCTHLQPQPIFSANAVRSILWLRVLIGRFLLWTGWGRALSRSARQGWEDRPP